jgi:hypothetical protein
MLQESHCWWINDSILTPHAAVGMSNALASDVLSPRLPYLNSAKHVGSRKKVQRQARLCAAEGSCDGQTAQYLSTTNTQHGCPVEQEKKAQPLAISRRR